jgi:hypothetical protein
MDGNRDQSVPPTDESLVYLGFELWQIATIREYDMAVQWFVYDEQLRSLMSEDNFNRY